jgi:CTP synthase
VTEFGRNVCGLDGANSTEFNAATPHPVIDMMEEQKHVTGLGGTMRLGSFPCELLEDSRARGIYGAARVMERHRHRYEFNNRYRDAMRDKGMVFSGTSPDGMLVEMIEVPAHPWFVACQFHPEFQSTPLKAHPLFREFVGAALKLRDARQG